MNEAVVVFISLPMHGLTDQEIEYNINILKEVYKDAYPERNCLFIDNYHALPKSYEAGAMLLKTEDSKRIYKLSHAIKTMAKCDEVLMLVDTEWTGAPIEDKMARGCKVEKLVCELYNKPIMYVDKSVIEHYGKPQNKQII